jgi:hypothetical protein
LAAVERLASVSSTDTRTSRLRNLREEKTPRGQIDVRPTTGNDDTAVALALAVNEAITQEAPLPFEAVPVDCRPSAESLGLIPGNCRVEAVCANFPDCMDEGHCKDWVRLDVGALVRIKKPLLPNRIY